MKEKDAAKIQIIRNKKQGCGSGLTSIRIRIHKVIESGSNADPDPFQNFKYKSQIK
jgi:hypothetical protein